jgi:hypothetical protein
LHFTVADEPTPLQRIARLNAQLASSTARIDALVTALLDSVSRLVRAADSRDWAAVSRLSDELARRAEAAKDRNVASSARAVCEALRKDPSGSKAVKPLAKLLSACRAARQQR